jgi:hypothetical protein
MDRIMETLQILYAFLYYYGVGPSFPFNTAAALLGMNSCSFEQPLQEFYTILHEERLQVVGCGNLFLSLVSKTDQSG